MWTSRRRVLGAVVSAGVVAAGAWLWVATGDEEPPPRVASVRPVEDDALDPAGSARIVLVEPDVGSPAPLSPRSAPADVATVGEPVDLAELTVGGYEGWWSGDGDGAACDAFAVAHPEVVLVSTRSAQPLEAFVNGTRLQGVPNGMLGEPAEWPADSVVVLDARTGEVLDAFEVDESGWRLEVPVDCVPPSETP
ncbi:hypothetical protein ACIOWF_04405 [Cellulosimicrobium cellulans]|uniref:hypothetical protein n=1 Tax=Cellulosimicrobium cellulans TaxID=1710 RepID=UPI0028A7114A|nr:hypothetical protein [Cellulosimicrobium cellulans]